MIREFLNNNIQHFSKRLKDALTDSLKDLKANRYQFFTPEILLLHIVDQDEFMMYSSHNFLDIVQFRKDLLHYVQQQDRVPQDVEYHFRPSFDFMNLMSMFNLEISDYEESGDNKDRHCVDVPLALKLMYSLDESMAAYLLTKYLGEDFNVWEYEMKMLYKESTAFASPVPTPTDKVPHFHAEAYINGKRVDSEKEGQILGQMMAKAAQQLMDSVNSMDDADDDTDDDVDVDDDGLEGQKADKPSREPWESMVTCLNDIYFLKNPLVGRQKELERAVRILCRKDKNNPIFIGEPGVGKTAMIYGLTKLINEGRVPQGLKGNKVYALDMSTMVAGASFHGEFEKRMKIVLSGVAQRGNCILYIDEIHNIMNAGGGNDSINAAEMLKPYLEDGEVKFIGSTTYQEYNKTIANKKTIARRFATIDVKEPSCGETIEIINALLPIYEAHHGVRYTGEAVKYAVEQSARLINDRFLPDKAIDILDEAGALLQQSPLLNKKGEPKAKRYQKVDSAIVQKIFTDVCRIDAKALANESDLSLRDLDKRIAHDIYGQDDAIKQVVRAVMMSKAGLTEPDKPMASLLFVGPTGVGKTEVCKVLARELGMELVRFDMSEYTEKHTVSKLIGSPAGYVGYDEGGLMTDAIRRTPNCILLLDEIEKAHSDIYNILLQVMDYAKLTDNKGNKADFHNVILIMTSNAGAQFAGQAAVGFGGGQSKGQAMLGTVKKTFKPEFLNRLSGTVVFNEMDRTMASLILDKKLRELSVKLKNKNVIMNLSDEAYDFLLNKGFTDQYGAREIDRVINQYLTPLLMEEMLFGNLRKGGGVAIRLKGESLEAISR